MTPQKLRKEIAINCISQFGFDPFRKTRHKEISFNRQSFCHVLWYEHKFSLEQIREIVDRDPSTITYSIQTAENERERYPIRQCNISYWSSFIGQMFAEDKIFLDKVTELFARLDVNDADRKLLNEVQNKLFYAV